MTTAKSLQIIQAILFMLIVVLFCPFADGKIIYVDDNVAGANDGTSWADAYKYLQDALADANSAEKPIEIKVAQGIYKPDIGGGNTPGDGRATFQFIDGVPLKGGFAGYGEPDPNARNVDQYETVLSGDLLGNDIEVANPEDLRREPTRSENSYTVLTLRGNIIVATLDGFTITGGEAFHNPNGGGPYSEGGGLKGHFANADRSITVRNCTFSRNSAAFGGGMLIADGSLTLVDCMFSSNRAGMHIIDCNATLTNCTFSGNKGGENAGGLRIHDSNAVLTSCTFSGNLGEELGGGMIIGKSNVILTNCMFTGNSSGEIGGGFLSTHESNSTLINCTFTGNSAVYGGGMYNRYGSIASLINCTFAQNSADQGAGLYSDRCCDVYGFWSIASLTNCILWGGENEIGCEDESMLGITITYSDIQGGFPGEGNINTDPLFAVLGYYDDNGTPDDVNDDLWINGDYHLKSQAGRYDPNTQTWVQDDVTSPCIDAGDPNSSVTFEPYPNGSIINMGAYGGSAEASKSPSGLHSKYGGGTGEPNDPYLIYTAEHLNALGAEPNDYDKHFKLMADIDLSRYTYDRAVIAPDMNDANRDFDGTPFTGVFEGNNHIISRLSIVGESYLGLFGRLESGATVSNLGLEAVDVSGMGDHVGGLVGLNHEDGSITNSYSTGTVTGGEYVGGLVGVNFAQGSITASYSTSTVTGSGGPRRRVGGLVGRNYGSITASYSTGAVTGEVAGGLVAVNEGWITMCYSTGAVTGGSAIGQGGLVCFNMNGQITSCFWDMETSGAPMGLGGLLGTGLTTAEMQTASTFLEAGWDFVDETENGTEDIWWILEGQDYPRLWWEGLE